MRVSVKEAARALGVSEQYVRIGLQRGRLPIGSCVKMSSVWTYHISEEKLREYLGEQKMPPAATDGNRHSQEVKAERTL